MDPRLDAGFESSGGFTLDRLKGPLIHGRLQYDPEHGIGLELVENPFGPGVFLNAGESKMSCMFGQLADGTWVTLFDCFITNSSIPLGGGIGSPTTLKVNRALFGCHLDNLDELAVKKYWLELSSLSNWTGTDIITKVRTDEFPFGMNIHCRQPLPLKIELPDQPFDIEIAHWVKTQHDDGMLSVKWGAAIAIVARESLPLNLAASLASRCHGLISLLVGESLSVRSVAISKAFPTDDDIVLPIRHIDIQNRAYYNFVNRSLESGDSVGDWVKAESQLKQERTKSFFMLYEQMGRHDHKDVHPALMMLPYRSIVNLLPTIFSRWFGHNVQAVLATNIFFGSQNLAFSSVDVKFLNATQALESYDRSFGKALYMDQGAYDAAIHDLAAKIPATIQDDHRHSLKNRLKYGNEFSLRKRLTKMLERIPENVKQKIAGPSSKFIQKVVDTRNYYTHYDHASQAGAFQGKDAYVAAERLRLLLISTLLHDLGIPDDVLLTALEKNRDFVHWTNEPLLV
jgi:hypothetical protein